MVKDGYGTTCNLCARADTLPRPPTAEEEHSRGRGSVTDYTVGIFALDYVPTPEELSRAVW